MSDNRHKPKAEGILFLRNLPDNLKAQFKAYAARRGKTMTELVLEYMLACVRKDVDKQEVKRLRKEVVSG